MGIENDYLTDVSLSAERVWLDGDFSRTLTRYIRERLKRSAALFPSKLADHSIAQMACDGLNKFAITVEVRLYRLDGSRSSLADVQFVPSDALIGDIIPTKRAVTERMELVQLCRTAVEWACLSSRIGVAVSPHVSSSQLTLWAWVDDIQRQCKYWWTMGAPIMKLADISPVPANTFGWQGVSGASEAVTRLDIKLPVGLPPTIDLGASSCTPLWTVPKSSPKALMRIICRTDARQSC